MEIGGVCTDTISIERTINAPIEKVWSVAGDFLKAPAPSISIRVKKEGDPDLHGVGAERIVTVGFATAHERLDTCVPMSHFTYTLLSGPPIRDHHGRVDFVPDGSRTTIRMSAWYRPRIPGTGWICKKAMTRVLNTFLDAVENATRDLP